MSEEKNSQLLNRKQESFESIQAETKNSRLVFAYAPSDLGVRRNQGRPGSRFGFQAFLPKWKKLNLLENSKKNHSWSTVNLLKTPFGDLKDEIEAELFNLKQITSNLMSQQMIIHFGGGHDHIYPLIKSLDCNAPLILNLDAHLDTRIDPSAHSGNPFRRLDKESQFSLFQVGIQKASNSLSTQQELNSFQSVLFLEEMNNEKRISKFQKLIESKAKNSKSLILSLDCDVLNSAIFPAVSAVNPTGIDLKALFYWSDYFLSLAKKHQIPLHIGVYEFNPIYDDNSGRSAKLLAHWLFQLLA